jgi:hypothetical protein
MGSSWLLQRFLCFCRGHRKLTSCASYSAGMQNGRVRELRYCLACDSPVWVEQPADATPPSFPRE